MWNYNILRKINLWFLQCSYIKRFCLVPHLKNHNDFSLTHPQSTILSLRTALPGFYGEYLLGASKVTANLYCNCVHLYWEGCLIWSMYLRWYMKHVVLIILISDVSNIVVGNFGALNYSFIILYVQEVVTHFI